MFNIVARGWDSGGPILQLDSRLWTVDMKIMLEGYFGSCLSSLERAPSFDLRTHMIQWQLLRALQQFKLLTLAKLTMFSHLRVALRADAEVRLVKDSGNTGVEMKDINFFYIPGIMCDFLPSSLKRTPLCYLHSL